MKGLCKNTEKGFTLPELLVGLFMFSLFSLMVATFLRQSYHKLAVETRGTLAAQELRNALGLMANELRMGAVVSPYLPGTDPDVVACFAEITANADKVSFLVVHDDSDGSSGIQPYHVGYVYDSANNLLLRGELEKTGYVDCTLPGGDPTASSNTSVIAENIVQIDSNGDGTDEDVFSYANGVLTINVGVEILGPDGVNLAQPFVTQIAMRRRS